VLGVYLLGELLREGKGFGGTVRTPHVGCEKYSDFDKVTFCRFVRLIKV
jgi:hypothetical protein